MQTTIINHDGSFTHYVQPEIIHPSSGGTYARMQTPVSTFVSREPSTLFEQKMPFFNKEKPKIYGFFSPTAKKELGYSLYQLKNDPSKTVEITGVFNTLSPDYHYKDAFFVGEVKQHIKTFDVKQSKTFESSSPLFALNGKIAQKQLIIPKVQNNELVSIFLEMLKKNDPSLNDFQ